MREIKFRAWHIYDNVMVECDDGIGGFYYNGGMTDPDYTKLQYTGLKDKNGQPIYEGDIIRSTETDEVLKIGEMTPLSRHLDMLAENIGFFDGKDYHIRDAGGQYHLDDWVSNPEFYKVIGNIYENPDLLKQV